jgi:putative ABC transport system ATP-binding protein
VPIAAILRGVTKAFGSRQVLDAFTHTFAGGRLHVVAGPSGSGKTTLLDLVAALDQPDAGSIRVGEVALEQLSAAAAAGWRASVLGHLGQHASLAEQLSALENVALAAAFRGIDGGAAVELLDWVGLADVRARAACLLSGGERRRVALARALIGAPRLVVADEPTAHLDRPNGRLMLALLRRAADEHGVTVIASSHDPDALEAADEVLQL